MLLVMVVLAVFGLPLVTVRAAAPDVVSYQGRLLNSNGVPVTDASLEFVFRFFDASAGGACLWESDDGAACDDPDETQTVALTDGLFSENIGSAVDPTGLSEAYPADLMGVFEGATDVWLEVVIAGETLTPRKQMVAAPYALDAQALDGMDSTDFLASAGDTGTGVFDFSGATFAGGSALSFEGATPDDFETTFAFTDPTVDRTITFQNADGTVAFLSDIAAGAGLWETGAFATYEDDDDVVVGTSLDETIAAAAFALSGNDLFVAGDAGVEGVIFSDSGVNVSGTVLDVDELTFVGSASVSVTGTLTLSAAGSELFVNAAQVEPTGVTDLGDPTAGWDDIYVDVAGTTIGLEDTASAATSGAFIIGAFDEFDNSAGANVQDVLDDLDAALATGGAGSMWTLAGGVVYPTSALSDLAVGGTTAAASPFGVDESANTVYVGEGANGNGTIVSKSSDGDTGSLIYNTNDTWEFSGGNVLIDNDLSTLGNVSIDLLGTETIAVTSAPGFDTTADAMSISFAAAHDDTAVNLNYGLHVIQTDSGLAPEYGADALIYLENEAPDGAAAGLLIGGAGAFSYGIDLSGMAGGQDIRLNNSEIINNITDDLVSIGGSGGADNTDIEFDLDGTMPVLQSATDASVSFNDNLLVGATSVAGVKADFALSGDDLYAAGDIAAQFNMYADSFVAGDASTTFADGSISTTNQNFSSNISVSGVDALVHTMSFQIDGNNGMTIVATGDGAGGVGARTISIGTSVDADVVAVGDANADVSITDAQWSVSGAGAASFSSLGLTAGNLDMTNNLVLNIGNAGTDFVAGGGLTLAGVLTANGTATFNSDVDIAVDGTENVVIGNTTGTGSNNVDLVSVNVINTDAAANTQRGLVITNQAASSSATESLITLDNADAIAVTSGLSITGSGGAVTTAITVSDANIGTALSVGDNTISGGAAQLDFTDFDVSADGAVTLAPDDGGIALSIAPGALLTAGIDFANTNVGLDLQLQNDESISNQTDDIISFGGAGGGDNTDLQLDLDGTRPVLFSTADSIVAFADNIEIDPTAGNATIDLYASDADTGSLAYTTNDAFSFSGGNISHVGLDLLPSVLNGKTNGFETTSTFTGTSAVNLSNIQLTGGSISAVNQAAEGGGAPATIHEVFGVNAGASNSGPTAQAEKLIGSFGQAQNSSGAAAAIGDYAAGVEGFGLHNSVGLTIPDMRGISGRVSVNNGTVTDLFAVRGEVETGGGGATTSYGGYFDNNNEGLTRYGVLASASGGATANYAAYFHSAAVHVETSATPSTATLATGAGDLFVDDQFEVTGASVTNGNIAAVVSGDLTTGIGLVVQRSTNAGSDFTNTTSGLVDFTITDAGSTGNVLFLQHSGAGTSLFVDPNADTGNTVSDSSGGAVHIANTGNSDYGLTVYTNDDTSDANTSLSYFFNDNTAYDGYVMEIRSDAATADTANGTALHLIQNQVDSPAANAVATQAFIIDVNEKDSTPGDSFDNAVLLIRSDADNDGDGGAADRNTTFRIDLDGDFYHDGTQYAAASDLAEEYPVSDDSVAGNIVSFDAAGGSVSKTSGPYAASIAGVISTMPGVVLGFGNGGQPLALSGRVPTFVTDENGAIAAGDPITSSSTAGYGMKATEPGMIVGFALEDFSGPGSGSISVFIGPQFYMGGVISTDGSVTQIEDNVELTGSLSVLGSNGTDTAQMALITDVTDATDYRLSIENADGTQVAYVSNEGDLALAGRLYPSDRGTLQTSKYIYYDGSSGMGGDFMRTNASGWATGSYDFAEMFPSADTLEPGDVVVFGATDESVARSSEASDPRLAGIVSTRPGFLAGENIDGHYPIALAGRVPTKVTDENGSIKIGDPLTSSSRTGYAMKATEAGAIVGYALEPFDGSGDDKIVAYVNVSYWNGGETPELPGTENIASTIVVTQNASNFTTLNMNGNVYMTANDILGVRRIAGMSERWSIEEDGTVRTPGVLKTITESYQGENVETAAVTSPDVQISLVGTGTLENGEAVVRFEDASPSFNDVTSTVAPIRVVVTPNGPVSLYVFEKDNDGFGVRQVNGRDSGVTFDWMVSAYRKGYEPVEEVVEEEAVEEVVEEEAVEEVVEEAGVIETVEAVDVIEAADETTVIEEPVETAVEEMPVDPEPQTEVESAPEPVVTEDPAPPASPEPIPDDSMESTVVEEPAP